MKVAVLSDIHGNGIALRYAIKDLKELGVRKVIVLGDVVMKGPMPAECMELLKDKDLEIIAWIKGNTELWFDEVTDDWLPSNKSDEEIYTSYQYAVNHLQEEQITFLKNLPLTCSMELEGVSILCVHGTPKSIVEAIDYSVSQEDIKKAIEGVKERVILCGHSHTSFIGEVDGKWICNVGSVGNSLDDSSSISYGILHINAGMIQMENRKVAYPVDGITYLIV